jgi:nucleoside-diphosphate-sugar epimerase
MKVLITGSSGFIGCHLTRKLSSLGYAFDVVKRAANRASKREAELEINWPDDISGLDLSSYTSVIHLATAATKQTDDYSSLKRDNLDPIEHFLKAIQKTNPRCSFIFVSSQSAIEQTDSVYGKLKWEAERLLKASACDWTILRPGLVLGSGGKGLSNRMLQFLRKSPVVPLIGKGDQLIQPVSVQTVVDALLTAAQSPEKFAKKDFSLVTDPVTMRNFLGLASKKIGRRRLFVSIPEERLAAILGLLERILKNPPITKTNLLGLTKLRVLSPQNAYQELQLKIESLDEILDHALSMGSPPTLKEECESLYKQLFGESPPLSLITRYERAHDYCCLPTPSDLRIDIDKIINLNLDVESIEYATRAQKTRLSKKIVLLSYLAEVEPGNYETFVNKRSNWPLGMILLGYACARAPWKFFRGRYLLWRHGLV